VGGCGRRWKKEKSGAFKAKGEQLGKLILVPWLSRGICKAQRGGGRLGRGREREEAFRRPNGLIKKINSTQQIWRDQGWGPHAERCTIAERIKREKEKSTGGQAAGEGKVYIVGNGFTR